MLEKKKPNKTTTQQQTPQTLYKTESFRLEENRAPESSSNDMSVLKGPQAATEVVVARFCWRCVKDYAGPQTSRS